MSRPSVTQVRRKQIVEGMFRVMVGSGYEAATIRRIATAARLTPGLVHHHFKNKLQILCALLEHLETEHARYLDFELFFAEDPAEKLAIFIDHHLSSCGPFANIEAVSCWAIVSGEGVRQSGFAEKVENAFKRMTVKLTSIVRAGIEAGVFDCPTPEPAAVALMTAIHGYLCVAMTTLEVIPHVSAAPCVKMMAAGLLQSNSPCLRDAAIPPPLSDEPARSPATPSLALSPAPPDLAEGDAPTGTALAGAACAEPDASPAPSCVPGTAAVSTARNLRS